MGSSKKQTIGYAYFMGLHMVVAKSADALLAIRAGGRDIFTGERFSAPPGIEWGHFRQPYDLPGRFGWSGDGGTTPVTANERLNIWKPEIFGGKDREGGIVGALDVLFGEPTQTANDYLESVLGAPQPAYRGSFGLVFRGGMVGALNPYLKAWEFRIRRNLKGWQGGTAWYASACEIDVGQGVRCMNPAHIIYQVLTDAEDGMGYPAALMDDANMRAAADLFKAEGLGLFFRWNRSDKIESFIQQVADHCNAFVVQDPATGLFQIKPMRGGYDASTLLTLTPSNATLEMFDRGTLEETVNEITVKWDDTFTRSTGSITGQSMANIQAMGGVINQTKTYGGCPTEAIASRLLQRDLDIASALLARVRIKANRVASRITPGDVIKIEGFAKAGLQTVVVRVLRVRYGGPSRQEISIEGAEDVFGLPLNSYIGDQGSGWTPPSTQPQASASVDAYEIPFRDLAQIQGTGAAQALSPPAGFLGFVASRPPGLPVNFELITKQGSEPYQSAGSGDFVPTATTAAAIGKADTTVALTAASGLGTVDVGSAAFIGTHPIAEAVRVVAISGASMTVARGALDTTPSAWPAGTRIWFYDEAGAGDPSEYVAGEVVDAKALTITSTGRLKEADAITDSVTFASRAARPYPPARFRINAAVAPATAYGRLALTWNHRDRIVQADTVVGTEEPSIGPEPGVTYTARIYKEPSTLVHTETGITGAAFTYTFPAAAAGAHRVELEAVRGGLASWQAQRHTITIDSAELVTNGEFGTDTAWDKGADWSISGGSARKIPGAASELKQTVALVAGARYRVAFTVSSWVAGSITARLTGPTPTAGAPVGANGSYVHELVATANTNAVGFNATATFDGRIDDVSVRRIG